MEKKHIIRFLKHKKRGVYKLIVEMYADVITSMAVTMALDIIREDLQKESGESVQLNYFSLAQAAAKFKKSAHLKETVKEKWTFKDSHEIKEPQIVPGRFKLDQSR